MSEVSDDEYDSALEMVRETIGVILTPEVNEDELETGLFHLYTIGMRENLGLQEMEMRNVPGMFSNAGLRALNELAAYQYVNQNTNPILVGQRIGWSIGDLVVTNGEDWDGRYSWTSEEMLRFESLQTTVMPGPNCLPGEP
jgi:hypothetical protein